MEDEEYKKLPIEDRCVHKLWKARVSGYEEVTKLFRQIDDEKSPEFAKYLGLIRKFVVDSNAMGQEKGLEATLAYIENYAHAGKAVGEVMGGIVAKCIAAPRTKTRDLALQITLMYVEIQKPDIVQEELLKGMELKNPKIVAACVTACTMALKDFGSKVFPIKPLIKKASALFADRDKAVRDEARLLVIEMYRWAGAAIKSQLTSLQPVQLTELEGEFAKIDGQKAVPSRYLRSQQEKQAKLAAEAVVGEECDDGEEDEAPVQLDPYEMADPVDIISKLPKDFYDKLEAKKWQDRKEALEVLENLVKAPKLENGDYGDIVRALRKIVQKDSNVVVVTNAAKCLTGLANGLKRRFQTYAGACVSPLLEKFKEKKQAVVTAIRDAIDAVFMSTTIEAILEDVLEALGNKNPNVKSETALFLARSFTKILPTALNKKLLKALTGGLIKIINEPDPTVRDSASEALGTLLKLVGDKAVGPFLVELEKDNLKMIKIRECCEKAVITVKAPGAKKERPLTAPVKGQPQSTNETSKPAVKPTRRPTTGTKKRPTEISCGTATIVKSKGGKRTKPSTPIERNLSEEEVDAIVSDLLPAEIINGLSDSNWKTRLSSAEQMLIKIQEMDAATVPTQAFVKTIGKKPGLKDTNFQVLKARIDVVKYLASNCTFSIVTADACLNDITEKLGDVKNGSTAADTLTSIAEAISLAHVSNQLIDFATTQKSPKVLQESLNWLANAIKEFGFANLNARALIDIGKKSLGSTNPAVRAAAISYMGILYLYIGPTLHTFFENEKQSLRDQINIECDKYENEKPPAPTRGIVKTASSLSINREEEEEDTGSSNVVNIQDLIPRVDISGLITETLIKELSDKNWKVRNESLTKITAIINDAKSIKQNLGELPQALAQRLMDSNSKIAQSAMVACETIATAMGPPSRSLIRVVFPGLLLGLGDRKSYIRLAALSAINTFGEQCGYKDFFEGEMIADGLKTGSPTLKSEVWAWLAEKLPKIPVKQIPKDELLACIQYLYPNLEDRSADVRKNAQEAVLGVMIHLGYEGMVKQTEKLKPGSKSVVIAALDKARPNLPARPEPVKKRVAPEKAVRGSKPVANAKTAVKPKAVAAGKQPPATSRKKDDDIDTSPLLVINNMKHQRTIDESKLKVLKWNFTTPREEFVDLLKEQMTNANVNKTLMTNMFHSDFKFHIKAIESLVDDIQDNSAALTSNLDLILKWLTLRFFDTNPSVLLKGLEYLHSVFNMLVHHKYHMLENEASSFIPYLVLKIGDPKDSVRNGVRSLFKQITRVYSVSKLFQYIMEGLKSKNARQRAECLDVMGAFIEDWGITICLPSPAACLKEVAKQISDRDNSVRNAALNCVVQAYYIVGEKVYKMVGQISDKDMSLLEERIKRATKKAPKPKEPEPVTAIASPKRISSAESSPAKVNNVPDNYDDEGIDEDDEDDMPHVALPPQVTREEPEEVSGPFRLDPEFLQELDNVKPSLQKLQLLEFDLDFLKEEVVVPPTFADIKAKLMPLSPPKPILPNQIFSRATLTRVSPPRVGNLSDGLLDQHIEKIITQTANSDLPTSVRAIKQLEEYLKSQNGNLMINFEDHFMSSVTKQFKMLSEQNAANNPMIPTMYKALLTVIDLFYNNKILGRKISPHVLRDIMHELIIILVEAKLSNVTDADRYIRVVNLQCVKIIERSDHTNIICALLKLLHYCIETSQQLRFTDLVMKCLWRVIKIMNNWVDEIDYDSVLLEIHLFMKQFPTTWWKLKESDTPIRTVKTILHTMVKMKGATMTLHLGKIPNTNDSEMESYILKLLKSHKIEGSLKVPLKTETRRSLSRSTHTQLTDIFRKIGNKDETREGLNMLYDFLQQHPEADIEPFLKESSQFFQDYIQKNLKDIENSRKCKPQGKLEGQDGKIDNISNDNDISMNDLDERGPEYWRNRLEMWKKLWEEVKNG